VTYYLETAPGKLEPVDPNLYAQAVKLPRPTWFLACECGAMVAYGERCQRCEPPAPRRRFLSGRLLPFTRS
jgi:hypothetical protein